MTTYGNSYWNSATDNKNKSIISVEEKAYEHLKDTLNSSGVNYYAYVQNGSVRMAVDDKDINWLAQITGTDRISVQKSSRPYSPPEKNVFGNTSYKYISKKTYFSSDRDTALKMAEFLATRNISFSGRIYENGKATLTVSENDLETVKIINQQIIEMRKQFVKPDLTRSRDGVIIGNTPYGEIKNRHFFVSQLSPDSYYEIKDFMEKQLVCYSGLIRDNKVMFTVDQNDAAEFYRTLLMSHNYQVITSELQNERNISKRQLEILDAAIKLAASVNDTVSVTSFFNPEYSDEQLRTVAEKLQTYLSASENERMLDKNGILSDLIDTRKEYDTLITINSIVSEKEYNDEQKKAILDAFNSGLSETMLDQLDNSFSSDEIHEYTDIIHTGVISDIYSFFDAHNAAKESASINYNEPVFETPEINEEKERFIQAVTEHKIIHLTDVKQEDNSRYPVTDARIQKMYNFRIETQDRTALYADTDKVPDLMISNFENMSTEEVYEWIKNRNLSVSEISDSQPEKRHFEYIDEMIESVVRNNPPQKAVPGIYLMSERPESNLMNSVNEVKFYGKNEFMNTADALEYMNRHDAQIESLTVSCIHYEDYKRRGRIDYMTVNANDFSYLYNQTVKERNHSAYDYNRACADVKMADEYKRKAEYDLHKYLENPAYTHVIVGKFFAGDEKNDIYLDFKYGEPDDRISSAKKYLRDENISITIPGTDNAEHHTYFPVGITTELHLKTDDEKVYIETENDIYEYTWDQMASFLEKGVNESFQSDEAIDQLSELSNSIPDDHREMIRKAFEKVRSAHEVPENIRDIISAAEATMYSSNITSFDISLFQSSSMTNMHGYINKLNDECDGKLFEFLEAVNAELRSFPEPARDNETELIPDQTQVTEEQKTEPVRIYQLNKESRDALFMSYSDNEDKHLNYENYDIVYESDTVTLNAVTLDDIYYVFNMNHPEDFHGHSLSVSDVIVLGEEQKAYYVDSFGFKEFPDFIPEKQQEKIQAGVIEKYNLEIDFNSINSVILETESSVYEGGLDSEGHERKDNFSNQTSTVSFYVEGNELTRYDEETEYDTPVRLSEALDEISDFLDNSRTNSDLSAYIENADRTRQYINAHKLYTENNLSPVETNDKSELEIMSPVETNNDEPLFSEAYYEEIPEKNNTSQQTAFEQMSMFEGVTLSENINNDLTEALTSVSAPVTDVPEQTAHVNEDTKNFVITDEALGEGGPKTKFANNLAAIKTLKLIESENRSATHEEKETLSGYVGWGGLQMAFEKDNESWKNEYEQLRNILTPHEYSSARVSTLDSFYTSPAIMDGIYAALDNFGFKGGNILEPACGVGNFIGRMPEQMKDNSSVYGVEIDSISGRIAQKLYNEADIQIKGFEKTKFQNGCFDVAVGNVPFGDFNIDYKAVPMKIHDYFFMQSLDKVKDGGIVAFVTSTGTLDKKSEEIRKAIAKKADLIGAVRLPSGAFRANAGTDVTTDIIFLQKRSEPPEQMPEWIHTGENENGLSVNKYYLDNPDKILGIITPDSNPFSSGTKVIPHENAELKSELLSAVSTLSAQISQEPPKEIYDKTVVSEIKPPVDLRNYSYFIHEDKVCFKKDEDTAYIKFDQKSSVYKRAAAFTELRDITRNLITAQEQNKPDETINSLQAELNKKYDSFYSKFGLIHNQTNKKHFGDDVSYNLVASLEKTFEGKELKAKSDIFTKRTICPPKAIDHVDTAIEALMLSMAEKTKVDFEYMEHLTGMTRSELFTELGNEIYLVPGTQNTYQTSSEYLSGDIRKKLSIAEEAAKLDSRFEKNIAALERSLPEPLKAGDIEVKIGSTWFNPKIYEQFMYETFETPDMNRNDVKHRIWDRHPKEISVEFSNFTGIFKIENAAQDKSITTTKTYGTNKISAYEIMESLLNLRDPKVSKTVEDADGTKHSVVDFEATKLAQKKADKIKTQFNEWIFRDPERREMIVQKYNELFNSIRPREYDGSALTFPNMNADIHLHDHQKNAIAHSLFGGNTLFAHSVGAGKTYEMIASAMESKRLGLCNKSLFVVPNHLTEQIGDDFQKLYPGANILVAEKNDFKKENRQKLFAKIATGSYDAVIIGHSQITAIKMSPERQERILNQQITEIVDGIEELTRANGSKFQIKQMENILKNLKKDLESLSKKDQDDVITFEEMGIDKMYVDEVHEFKNLFTKTKLQNVAGISNSSSQKAFDLFTKCRYLDEKTGGKGVVFATGTPLSNSVTELHTMMRYLEYDFLKDRGLQNFDNWVAVFGSQKTDWELAPAGNKFKLRTRIANYTGLPELMSMFKQVADVKTADTLKLDVPECQTHVVNIEATDFQKKLVQELADRADNVQDGKVDPTSDNMLRITSDGRKLGLDPRLIDASFEDNPNTKLNKCVENVFNIYKETAHKKLTQIIFCDLGVPHNTMKTDPDKEDNEKSVAEMDSLEEECDFCVYSDIKEKLMSKGVDEKEIAFIHDAKTEKQKSDLFEKVRSGEVRILLGSTSKMGTGTNVQDRLVAVHDLDIPWRPSDMTQRSGRMIRQGNQNKNVHLYRYVTKGTFDAYSFQTLECKQKFISQIMTSKSPVRKCEDVDQQALSYGEIKALCTGDERIKEKMQLDNEVKELKILKAEYNNTIYDMQDKVKQAPEQEERFLKVISGMNADREKLKLLPIDPETRLPEFKITLDGTEYTDKTEAGKALEKVVFGKLVAQMDKSVEIGEFHGFRLSVYMDSFTKNIRASIKGEAQYSVEFGISYPSNLKRLENTLYRIDQRITEATDKLSQLRVDAAEAKKILDTPFAQEQELKDKSERLETLTEELNATAMEAKMNGGDRERTYYFDIAKMKKEAAKSGKSVNNKDMVNDKGVHEI